MSGDRPFITCRELLDFLHLYLENELPPQRRVEFDRHLAVCEPCRNYIRQYEETIRLGRAAHADAEDEAVPEEVPPQLVRAVLGALKRS